MQVSFIVLLNQVWELDLTLLTPKFCLSFLGSKTVTQIPPWSIISSCTLTTSPDPFGIFVMFFQLPLKLLCEISKNPSSQHTVILRFPWNLWNLTTCSNETVAKNIIIRVEHHSLYMKVNLADFFSEFTALQGATIWKTRSIWKRVWTIVRRRDKIKGLIYIDLELSAILVVQSIRATIWATSCLFWKKTLVYVPRPN